MLKRHSYSVSTRSWNPICILEPTSNPSEEIIYSTKYKNVQVAVVEMDIFAAGTCAIVNPVLEGP